jgi:transposase
MAYRELTMIDVREVLRRWQAGQSARKIGRDTGTNRKTASRYIGFAVQLGLSKDRELTDEDIQAVAQCVQDRPEPDRSREWEEVARHRQRIEAWLEADRPLRLTKIHVLLHREGLEASYWTLRRYVMQELGWHKKRPTVLLEDPPAGQEAQVDFGKMGYLIDAKTGQRRQLWVLIVTLSYSRLSFVWPTFRQTTEAICEGLDRAWQFFGAIPKTIIPDNPKPIVANPDALNPRLSDSFADYVHARGIFVDPARIRSPQDKPRVENQVAYVRESWFAGEQFGGLDDARRNAEHWSREIAGRRIHGTTRRVPLEVFETEEKPVMRPAPTEPFDVPLWTDAKVHPDHHIQVARALYSVPTRYLHRKVRVRADSRIVRIYAGTELIKVHPRQPPGGRSTDPNDYPTDKAIYALRSVDAVLGKARQRGTHVGLYAERILSGPLPWARMRQAYALLRLCDKYGDGRVEALCQSSLAFDVIDVSRLKRMLKSAAKPPPPDSRHAKVTQLTLPRFARDPSHFETRPRSTDKEGS